MFEGLYCLGSRVLQLAFAQFRCSEVCTSGCAWEGCPNAPNPIPESATTSMCARGFWHAVLRRAFSLGAGWRRLCLSSGGVRAGSGLTPLPGRRDATSSQNCGRHMSESESKSERGREGVCDCECQIVCESVECV